MVDPLQEHADAHLMLWCSLSCALINAGHIDPLKLVAQVATTRREAVPTERQGVFFNDVVDAAIRAMLRAQYGSDEKIPETTRKAFMSSGE